MMDTMIYMMCIHWYGSFGSGEAHNLPFAIGTITGSYHYSVAALARDNIKKL